MNPNTKEITEQKSYNSSFTANISAREAMKKIEQVSGWWTAGFEGKSQNVGDIFRVQFGETLVNFKVVELIPDKKAAWLVTDCYLSWIKNKKEWEGTKVVWELASEKDETKVTMTHVGLVPSVECYGDCKLGWDFYVTKSLQKFLAEGKGLPDERRSNQ